MSCANITYCTHKVLILETVFQMLICAVSSLIPSTDLQNVNITLRILFRPLTTQLPRIFTSIGEDYDERVLPSITTEVLKSVVVSISQELLPKKCSVVSRYGRDEQTPPKCDSRFFFSQARFDAGELITQRELVSRQVSEDLTERANTFGLILDDVSLVRSCLQILQPCLCCLFKLTLTVVLCSFRHT